jgi:hypothetical protein
MEVADLISPEVWEMVRVAIERHEHWAAYDNTLLFVHEDDIQFFGNKEDAGEYDDRWNVIRIDSLDDFKKKVERIMPGVKYVPAPVASSSLVMKVGRSYFPKQILNERKTKLL